MTTGIYKITNKINNKSYIGASTNIEKRWQNHKHGHTSLKEPIKKYGLQNFTFTIIEECPQNQLIQKEKEYIKKYNTYHNGYNQTQGGEHNHNTTGYYHVHKIKNGSVMGYSFVYEYIDSNNNRKSVSNINIKVLELKVKRLGLVWKILDEEKAENTFNQNMDDLKNNPYYKNDTGFYRVFRAKDDESIIGFYYGYQFNVGGEDKRVFSSDLNILKKKVIAQDCEWKIIDEEKAKETILENDIIQDKLTDYKDNTGFYRVSKTNSKIYGFYYKYYYHDENGKLVSLQSTNVRVLQDIVENKGLEWRIINSEKAENTLNESDVNTEDTGYNNTGFYHVGTMVEPRVKQGFVYRYCYVENGKKKSMSSVNIKTLERKVKEKGLDWKVVNQKLVDKNFG